MSSEPPEEPLKRSEFNVLSPASPKPIHFPAPTNIPVLDMQTDVGFNQMEPHMSDPATRNTETRPDMWQDPNEQLAEPVESATDASPYSTGADAPTKDDGEVGAGDAPPQPVTMDNAGIDEISASTTHPQPTPLSASASNEADQTAMIADSTPLPATAEAPMLPDPTLPANAADAFSAQTDEVKLDQPISQSESGEVDIQGLLNTLSAAPAANDTPFAANGMPTSYPAETHSPSSELPNAPAAPGVGVGSSPLSASNLGVPPSGLPPRPPPQEQPLINPNYAHSQHIRDYHPHASHSAYQPHSHTSSQGNAADPSSRNYVPPVGSPGGNAQSSNGLPSGTTYSPTAGAASGQGIASYTASPASAVPNFTPNQGTFPFQYPQGGAGAASSGASRHAGRRPEDRPWDAEVQRKYDHFLDEERKNVAEGRWEQFPQGSRLFVGKYSCDGDCEAAGRRY